MPFKSQSQVAKFGELVEQGKMTQAEFNKWMEETVNKHKLPKKVAKSKYDHDEDDKVPEKMKAPSRSTS